MWEPNYLQNRIADFLVSKGITVEKAKGEGAKREDVETKVLIGPDDVQIETAGVNVTKSRLVRERRRVAMMIGAKTPEDLETKLSNLIPLFNEFIYKEKFPIRIRVSQSYDTTLKLYIAEIVIDGSIEYVLNP